MPQVLEHPGASAVIERHIDELPVLPTVVAQLMCLDPKGDSFFDEVRRIIETDPNFSARVLTAANSAASSPKEPITTVRAAVTRLGSISASNLILSFAVTRVFVPKNAWERSLWRHALQVAVAARALAARARDPDVNPDEAYACALLHDVGRFVLFQAAPDQLRRVDESQWHTPEEMIAQERAICGLTHTELGALACAKWRLPDTVTAVVRDHHARPKGAPLGRVAKLTALIHFADIAMFPSAVPGTPGYAESPPALFQQQVLAHQPEFLRLTGQAVRDLMRAAANEADAVAKALGIPG